jgi:quercetin dioxygenase-like cupin family protein
MSDQKGSTAAAAAAQPAAGGLVVRHADTDRFEPGLRAFFEYRDLGIAAATGGQVQAHVIRARPGDKHRDDGHYHTLDFQMVYVLKGWVRFEYEGTGEVLLRPGSCVYQPPGIRHREIDHSDDLELLEITMPAEFETVALKE